MSMSGSGDEATDDLFQHLVVALQRVRQVMRQGRRVAQGLLNRFQRRRSLMEDARDQEKWDPETDRRMREADGPNRTLAMERAAAELADRRDSLGEQVEALQEQKSDLEAGIEHLNDGNGNGIKDTDIQDLTDQDNDGRPDAAERRDEDRQNEAAVDSDGDGKPDAAERLEEQQEQAEARRKREKQDPQQREDGIDPATAAGAAAGGAAVAAEALDDGLDEQAEQEPQAEQEGQDLDGNGEQQNPANEAGNLQQAEADNDQQPNPDVTDEADRAQDPALDAENPQLDSDIDNALGDPAVDADNALDDPSRAADNELDADPSQEAAPSPYVTDRADFAQANEVNDPALGTEDPTLGSDQDGDLREQGEVEAGDDSPDAEALNGQGADLGEEVDPNRAYVDDGQEQDPGLDNDGTDLDPNGSIQDPQQVDPRQMQAPEQSGQGMQAGEQGTGQVPQPKGPDTQQIAQTAQTTVDESANIGQDGQDGQSPGGQSEGRPASEAQGSQWRPAEQPAIDEVRRNQQPNGRQSGPGQKLPSDEKAQFDRIRGDQEPLSTVKVDSGSVATTERPGTPAAQRGQDRDRGGRGTDSRGNDGGRER